MKFLGYLLILGSVPVCVFALSLNFLSGSEWISAKALLPCGVALVLLLVGGSLIRSSGRSVTPAVPGNTKNTSDDGPSDSHSSSNDSSSDSDERSRRWEDEEKEKERERKEAEQEYQDQLDREESRRQQEEDEEYERKRQEENDRIQDEYDENLRRKLGLDDDDE